MKYKIYLDEIPNNITIWEYIKNKTNITDYIQFTKNIIELKHNYNINEIFSYIKNLNYFKWKNKETNNYYGISLNHNNINKEYDCTLGIDNNNSMEFCYLNDVGIKIKSFFKNNFTFIRSRISLIDNNIKCNSNNMWHTDESIYENLRINIPILTNNNNILELRYNNCILKEGYLYSWNTELEHRVYNKKVMNFKRYNLVLGINPWFNFDEYNKCWISNEFYGKVQPLDLLKYF